MVKTNIMVNGKREKGGRFTKQQVLVSRMENDEEPDPVPGILANYYMQLSDCG